MKTTYKPKSLAGAQRKVRELQQQLVTWESMFNRAIGESATLRNECKQLAMLAAKGPAFFNPILVWEAEKVRDRWLKEMNMNPDGSFMPAPTTTSERTSDAR